MRRRRWICAATIAGLVAAAALAWPTTASADGGAYLDLDKTHYLPGQTAQAEGYVWVPRSKQDLFERGPFYVFVTPERSPVVEGRPLPEGAVRVGTVSIERDRGKTFELQASFVVPDLSGDSYALGVCNDPCTISGFREPLTGLISIVDTAREGELLNDIGRLNGRNWSLQRQVRKAERANHDLRAQLADIEVARSALAIRVRELESDAAAVPPPVARRPSVAAWSTVLLAVGLLVLAIVLLFRRRRTIELVISEEAGRSERVPAGR